MGVRVTTVNGSDAFVSWSKPEASTERVDGYRISVAAFDSAPTTWINLGGDETGFQVSGLLVDEQYTLRIVAYSLDESHRELRSEIACIHFSTRECRNHSQQKSTPISGELFA